MAYGLVRLSETYWLDTSAYKKVRNPNMKGFSPRYCQAIERWYASVEKVSASLTFEQRANLLPDYLRVKER